MGGRLMVSEEEIREELLNKENWETAYNRIVVKQGISKEVADNLWVIKELYMEDIVGNLMCGGYKWSTPRKVKIAKSSTSKKRVVYIYEISDRLVLGVIYRAVSKVYGNLMSDMCFSYKKGVGTVSALKFIEQNRLASYRFGVKIDIQAYFNSVSRERVIEMINDLFCGGFKDTIENLLLTDEVSESGRKITEWKALTPGSAFGSFLANYCLLPCDKYFEDKDCLYARYSDDILILAESEDKLKEYLNEVLRIIKKYKLTINEKKYTWFKAGEDVEYLGLKISDSGCVDMSEHSKKKIKKQIHRWCRKGRMAIERDYEDFNEVAKRVLRQINNKNFKCYIRNEATFGWCHYAFSKINTIDSLIEIDMYTRDTIRAMKTGRHNKANVRALSDEDLKKLGWVSLVDLYKLYKEDFDYYCEIIELI